MDPIDILLLKPESDEPSSVDQAIGARLAAVHAADCSGMVIEEASFRHGDLDDLTDVFDQRREKISAVVGATSVPESTRLGQLAESAGVLCFVANNNPAVWQKRRHVFHIGLPSTQSAVAVAEHLRRRNCRRIALIHDQTEFQRRVAANMEHALAAGGATVRRYVQLADADLASLSDGRVDVIYVIFSSEAKALPIARQVRAGGVSVPLLFGRSLMRQSFLSMLGVDAGESWFVDMFSRVSPGNHLIAELFDSLRAGGVSVPTANHAFGWDGMSFCGHALKAAEGMPSRAIAYLESAVPLVGVTGSCAFRDDNHNGRAGIGPTVLTRWHNGRFEDL
jgi:ABC-type branched-subunit amino acid transport system substrate-binding protein